MSEAIELRQGPWQDALADVGEVDTLISDPPYSERTHNGHDEVSEHANDGSSRRELSYAAWKPDDVERFVEVWSPRVRGWFVALTDHVLAPTFASALHEQGRYVFSPLSFVEPGRAVRILGDGPAQWAVQIVVARPRVEPYSKWGALPGGYVLPYGQRDRRDSHIGGKPLWLMRALVRDYSRPGNLIVDPCAGGATTLIAAAIEGRRAIGAELDPNTHALAMRRIAKGYTPSLFAANDNARPEPEQIGLLDIK
jgi:site-specific DNA-methyltransferase (adenine-specific)